jgi:hypothetical protein
VKAGSPIDMVRRPTKLQVEQVGAPTVPSAVFRGSNEFEDFRCHRSVTVLHSVTGCHVYFIFQLADFLGFGNF